MMVTESVAVVRKDEDRFDAPQRFLNGRFDLKVSAKENGGSLTIVDTTRTSRGGPPLHLHHSQEEWFMVVEGRFHFQIGNQHMTLEAGDSVLGPRGIPHAFANVTETGRLLLVFQPSGMMEEFFATGNFPPDSEEFREHSRRHGMLVVGPPLAPDER